ncbi:MAG TPA: DEDD exonuclease domain-containing protein [Dermatophilaceae bacterium]|jgi:DNA polymerase-3 subunit epsilon|uniref:DEDD exonuclease domain-containing protein n=1 Tax=Candidatus Phosphoribacter hodrii TaxID=2953743 RepID=A0A934X874_9MICO|nr:DEDD exonuclease domain-containing protein [Candidatus Phosphoribacter hodrii]MBP8838437.1 DEDD exonuclease domain-containing protein [Dermatophilaceae bacterium]HOA01821.1 DEDD exonuclease domain-containing protein [Dermatophilaceae bacterium]HOF36493.1 DEDD exonuclease domain-containing protein [Dermatophilaceae bacterium]HOR14915.1 DEDD exonuclease domain-containing protein [Dermatophilaceae bacterium]
MHAVQGTLDDLGTPLHAVTFVVVDLETTGGSANECAITEVGAVKVRGGEVLGEFQTLVNPGSPIPAFIQVLTGISDGMVAQAPRIDTVLPAFLEFARGSVLVAHNAGFDITFLKAAAEATGQSWPGFKVVDTVTLARQLVSKDEAPNRRLGSLAALFGADTTPDHRALHDARATVDVLHALLARVGNVGVQTLEELASYSSRVTTAQRRKRFLADDLPTAPGVYVFKDAKGRPLYVGTSRNIRVRARSYFTASEQRTRMAEMVSVAASIQPIVCQTTLEAQVRELRLIAEHKPRYNRRSTRPERALWVKLTAEPYPRLSIVREVRDDLASGARYAGPFGSRAAAEAAVAAVHDVLPLRQCTTRLSTKGTGSACVLAEMGRCGAPCEGRQSLSEYAVHVETAAALLVGDGRSMVDALCERMTVLAKAERFEDAGALRDRLGHLVRGLARAQRLAPLAASPELVAARRTDAGAWELVCVRHGRLAGTSLAPRGADPLVYVESLRATAEAVPPPAGPAPAAYPEETELVLRWLESPGVRIVSLDGEWTCPVGGAGAAKATFDDLRRGA